MSGQPVVMGQRGTVALATRRRSLAWVVGTAALGALVLGLWVADVAINASTRQRVEQRVEGAVSNGMQTALPTTPLTQVETMEGNYYAADVFRSTPMTYCVATAAWDDALQLLNQDGSAPLVAMDALTIWPTGTADAVNLVETFRYAGWLGRQSTDTITVGVKLPHYKAWHKTAGYPGPAVCAGS